jgi:nucleoside-diphosphate-sugar epimerase
MSVLITGHRGFIGRHFSDYWAAHGKVVYGIDLKMGEDCRDFFKGNNTIKFDYIVHCAAIVGGRLNIEFDPLGVATDLSIDAEFFNWCIRTKQTCPIVYFSSSAAYPIDLQGRHNSIPLREFDMWGCTTRIGMPDMTYGWAKLTGEYLAQIARDKYGLKVYVFRPFSGYGEDQDLTYPFPSLIQRAKQKEDPFVIWGSGNQFRDFIHVDDIVAAVISVTGRMKNVTPVNLCSGDGISFKRLAKLVTEIAGYTPEIICDDTKPEGVRYRVGNPDLMFSIYKPVVSLREGIERALGQ